MALHMLPDADEEVILERLRATLAKITAEDDVQLGAIALLAGEIIARADHGRVRYMMSETMGFLMRNRAEALARERRHAQREALA